MVLKPLSYHLISNMWHIMCSYFQCTIHTLYLILSLIFFPTSAFLPPSTVYHLPSPLFILHGVYLSHFTGPCVLYLHHCVTSVVYFSAHRGLMTSEHVNDSVSHNIPTSVLMCIQNTSTGVHRNINTLKMHQTLHINDY